MKRKAEIQIVKKGTGKKANTTAVVAVRPKPAYNPAFQKVLTGPELKNVDLAYAQAITISSGQWVAASVNNHLTAISQGVSDVQRIGRKVTLKSLLVNWSWGGSNITGGAQLRVLILYDKQTDGQFPAVNEVVEQNDFHSPLDLARQDRFILLGSFLTPPVSAQNNLNVSGRFYKKMNLPMLFSGAGGTIGDIVSGSIFMMCAQQDGVTGGTPQFQYYARVRFTDE